MTEQKKLAVGIPELKFNEFTLHEPHWCRECLTADECKQIIEFIETHKHKVTVGGISEYLGIRMMHIANPRIRELIEKVMYDILGSIHVVSGQRVYPEMISINKWVVGAHQDCHSDLTSTQEMLLVEQGYREFLPSRQWTSIFYLNDDFKDGQGYTLARDGSEHVYTPEVGSGIVFQGMRQRHGVKKIRRSARYTISLWFTTEISKMMCNPSVEDLSLNEDTFKMVMQGLPIPPSTYHAESLQNIDIDR